MKLCLSRTLKGFAAADDRTQKAMQKIPQGAEVWAEVSQPRTERGRRLFRRYWKLCAVVAENVEQYGGDSEAASDHILVMAGHCRIAVSMATGEILKFPLSIAWANHSEDLFDELWPRAVRAVCEHIMPGVTEAALEEEILRLIGAIH